MGKINDLKQQIKYDERTESECAPIIQRVINISAYFINIIKSQLPGN